MEKFKRKVEYKEPNDILIATHIKTLDLPTKLGAKTVDKVQKEGYGEQNELPT